MARSIYARTSFILPLTAGGTLTPDSWTFTATDASWRYFESPCLKLEFPDRLVSIRFGHLPELLYFLTRVLSLDRPGVVDLSDFRLVVDSEPRQDSWRITYGS